VGVDAGADARAEQERADQLAVQEHGLRWRRAQEAAAEREVQAELAHARRQRGAREVVGPRPPQRLADQQDQVHDAAHALGRLVGAHVADRHGGLAHALAVARHHGAADPRVARGQLRVDLAGGAEVEQRHALASRVDQVVREVRVGLHEAELEQLAEHEPLEQRADGVAAGLGDAALAERLDRLAGREVHRQHPARRQVVVDGGHPQRGLVGHQRAVATQARGLGEVVGLLAELALRLGDQARDVELHRQQARQAQQRRHVVDVRVDAAGDAGVLDLEREPAPVRGDRRVHLPDRGCRQRLPVEGREARLPAAPVRAAERAAHLRGGHRVGRRAQHGQRLGQLRRQQLRVLEREQLAELHGGAAQLREPPREPLRGGLRRGGHAAEPAPGAARQAAGRQLAGHPADPRQPLEAARRHARAAAPPRLRHGSAPSSAATAAPFA